MGADSGEDSTEPRSPMHARLGALRRTSIIAVRRKMNVKPGSLPVEPERGRPEVALEVITHI